MKTLVAYVARVAEHFKKRIGILLIEAYKLGTLARGGFSKIESDVGLPLNCSEPPHPINGPTVEAKTLDAESGKKLSVLWGT
jgi:hypothetical protein